MGLTQVCPNYVHVWAIPILIESANSILQVFGIGDSPKDSPLLLLAVETYDAYEQLVYLRDNVCKEYPEFAPLVRIISDCLNLDYKQRITASILYEKFVLLYNN